jgi:4'-phosphopantetheinyl transferase
LWWRWPTLRAWATDVALHLAPDEVHCWSVPLDAPAHGLAGLFETLAQDERDRAARLRFERDRRRFIVARAALRELLGRYVGTLPDQVRFAYNAFGKPELSPEFGRLKFNLSHSGDLGLIAVTWGADIGVDVEQIRTSGFADIAQSFFSPSELEQLSAVPRDLQARAFFRVWTRQEAYAKARGEGLGDGPVTRRGTCFSLEPAPGYIGAVAIGENGRESFYAAPYPQRVYGRYSLSRFALISSSPRFELPLSGCRNPAERPKLNGERDRDVHGIGAHGRGIGP